MMNTLHNYFLNIGAVLPSNSDGQCTEEKLNGKILVQEEGELKLRDKPCLLGRFMGMVVTNESKSRGGVFVKERLTEWFKPVEDFRRVAGFEEKLLYERYPQLVNEVVESPFSSKPCCDLEGKVTTEREYSYFKEFQELEKALEKGRCWKNAARQFASNLSNQPLDRQLECVSAMHKNVEAKAQSADKQSVRDFWKALQTFLHNHEDLLGEYNKKHGVNGVPKHIASQFSDLWMDGFSEDGFNQLLEDMLSSELRVSSIHKALARFFQSEINMRLPLKFLMESFQSEKALLESMPSQNRVDYCMRLLNLWNEVERSPFDVDEFDKAVIGFAEVRKAVWGDTFEATLNIIINQQLVEMNGEATERLRHIQSGMALVKLVSQDITLEGVHQLQELGRQWQKLFLSADDIKNKPKVLIETKSLTK
ncbi:MAG: hypothetical protein ACPG5T_02510, partial [Endozoicomonas sp.]